MSPRGSILRFTRRPMGITVHTALFAWFVTIGTLVVFALGMIPAQRRTFLDYLLSKANGVAVSLRDVAAAAAVSGDYSSVVDHSVEMLKGDSAIDYIVLTRNDGFSLIHDRSGWRLATLGRGWRPVSRVTHGAIEYVPLFHKRVYRFAQPFGYSGIDWGWIHVGLALDGFDQNVAAAYRRTALLAVCCGILGLVAATAYAKRLVRPILELQVVVRKVADGELSARAVPVRSDEIGQLASSVNVMTEALLRRDRYLKEANETLERRVFDRTRELEQQINAKERAHHALAEAQQHLIQLSREAGRAEIATGVLHSVGNVLNSVNVSATLLQDQLGHSELANLVRAVALLRTHEADLGEFLTRDPQGRHLPEFIIEVTAALAAEHESWRGELTALAKNIGHIKEIVATQQSYASIAGVAERVSPRELVTDAIRINQAAYAQQGVQLETHFDPAPDVLVDKHKALQILVNLLSNANWAVEHLSREQRRVQARVTAADGHVRIAVIDDGIGITPENLARIFRHGFTTRKNGHGFGLHMAAIAAHELGGDLTVHSDGTDRGATFTLELPAGTAGPVS